MRRNTNTAGKEHITLFLDAAVFEKVEETRGLVPRSTFINQKLRELFGISQGRWGNGP